MFFHSFFFQFKGFNYSKIIIFLLGHRAESFFHHEMNSVTVRKYCFSSVLIGKIDPTFATLLPSLFLILWFFEIQNSGSYYLNNLGKLSSNRYLLNYMQFSWEVNQCLHLSNVNQTTKCPIVIIILVTVGGKEKTKDWSFPSTAMSAADEKQTTCNDYLRQTPFYLLWFPQENAGILHCPYFQELVLSLFFLCQHFWEPSLKLS